MVKKIILLTFVFFSLQGVNAQDDELIVLSAKQNYESGNFVKALEQYLAELELKPEDDKVNYYVGSCYLKLNIDKSKAIPYLEKAIQSGKADDIANYELGLAYHINNKFEKAIKYYNIFLSKTKDSESKNVVERRLEMVNNAKELMKFPINVTFENLGKDINSEFADFNPYAPADESFIVYATKRYGVTGSFIDFDGYYTSDIFISWIKNGKYYRPKSIGSNINSELVEVPSGISVNGDIIFFNADNYNATGDIWQTEINSRGKNFGNGEKINGSVNEEKTYETGATLSSNGNILIFASEREGGFGGTDLYFSRKLPTGDWGMAINLGPNINTKYDEINPQLSFDEEILYFASEGHTSIGGFDIFKAEWNAETNEASNTKNIGYPVNTTDDQMTYCPTQTSRYGYIAALRPEGLGDLDIYRIVYNGEDPLFSVVKGHLIDYDTTNTIPITALITATNTETEEIVGTYEISSSKNSRFIIALSPGSYELMIEGDDYKMKLEKIHVYDKSGFESILYKDVYLQSNGNRPKPALQKTADIAKKEDAKPLPKVANTTPSSLISNKVIYKVQVEKTDPTLSLSYIHKLKEIGVEKEILKDGSAVYTKGNFINAFEAINLSKDLKDMGVKTVFPIAILNGDKIPLQQGIDYQKSQITD